MLPLRTPGVDLTLVNGAAPAHPLRRSRPARARLSLVPPPAPPPTSQRELVIASLLACPGRRPGVTAKAGSGNERRPTRQLR